MSIHSRKRPALVMVAFLLAAWFCPAAVDAQTTAPQPMSVTALVVPPYGPRLSDYTQKPGRLQVTINAPAFRSGTMDVYVEGKISSMDGNIEIFTKPGSKAGGIITLASLSTRMMTPSEIASIFSDQALVYQGISRASVLKQGLPEGAYKFCFKVFRSSDDSLLSLDEPSGCSNMFSFASVEPPMVLAPQNGAEIPSVGPQNVFFQWTIPPQAPAGTQYALKILEMDKPDRNPDEAFNSTGYPVFFEAKTATPLYLYSVANPPLAKGRKYAFRITAFVSGATVVFKNNGNSEVHTFTYAKEQAAPSGISKQGGQKLCVLVPVKSHPDSAVYVNAYANLYFRWTLNDTAGYSKTQSGKFSNIQFPGGNKDTLTPLTARYRVDFFSLSGDPNHPFHRKYVDSRKPFLDLPEKEADGFLAVNKAYGFRVVLFDTVTLETLAEGDLFKFKYAKKTGTKTLYSLIRGTLKYQFEGEAEAYSIPNASIRLKTVSHVRTKDGQDIEIDKDTSGLSNMLFQGKLFADKTDASGRFKVLFAFADGTKFGAVDTAFSTSINGKTVSGTLYYAVRVFIDNPYYHQPAQDIIVAKTDTTDAGVVTAFVKGYSLKAFVTQGYSATTQVNQQIVGKTVYLYRVNNSLSLGTPVNEGTKAMAGFSPGGSINYCTLIGEEKAVADKDKDGKNTASVSFTRLVANRIPGDEYYMLIKGADYKTAQKISFDIERKETGILDSIKNLPPMADFSAPQFGGGVGQGGQQVMSLQAKGVPGKTNADMMFAAMAGTNYVVQGFGGGSKNGYMALLPDNELFNSLEALADYPILKKEGKYGFSVKTAYRIITAQYPTSKIKGKLTYTWAGKPGYAKPMANRKITLIECLVTDDAPGQTKALYHTSTTIVTLNYMVKTVLATGVTKSDGSFEIQFNNTFLNYGKPYTTPKDFEKGPYYYLTGVTSVHLHQIYVESKLYSGTVKKVIRILVDGYAQDQYVGSYMSPENDFAVNPLDSLDAGTLVSRIASLGVKGVVRGKTGVPPQQSMKPLPGIECYLLRKNSGYVYPEGEGNSDKITGQLDALPDRRIIDKTETATDGTYSFHNFMALDLVDASTEFYFRTKDMAGSANYQPKLVSSMHLVSVMPVNNVFNNEFSYTEDSINAVTLTAGDPVVKGKVVSDVNVTQGIDGATCNLEIFAKGKLFYSTNCSSHDNGYFEFPITEFLMSLLNGLNLGSDPVWWSDIDSTVLTISKYKFVYKDSVGAWHANWRKKFGKGALAPGVQLVEPLAVLAAAGALKGNVICKVGHTLKPIPSYLQFVEKTANNTEGLKGSLTLFQNGQFQIPAVPGNHRLVVIPADPAYFSDTLPVQVNYSSNGSPTTVQIEVFERLHRVSFNVKSRIKAGNGMMGAILPVKGAVIELCDGQAVALSGDDGHVILKFKNVSVDNLTMKISGPQGGNFIPKYVTFQNAETDTMVALPDVILEKGLPLSGKVTLNNVPTSLARVYADVSYMPGLDTYSDSGYSYASKSVFEAEVKADGAFSFLSLPPELAGQFVPVYAVYQPPFTALQKQALPETRTIVGDFKLVAMPAAQPVVLNLTVMENTRLDNLCGFPMKPFMVKPAAANKYQVWGVVKLKGYSPGFDIMNEENIQFRVQKVEMALSGTDNGVSVYAPTAGETPIANIRTFKLKYFKTFNAELSSESGNELIIKRKGTAITGTGAVNGFVRIVDNSFKYPSSYLSFTPDQAGQFYFYLPKRNGPVSTTLDAFDAATPGNGAQKIKFHLKRKYAENLVFSFIGFDATADSRNSFIEGDAITLDATLNAHLKNAAPDSAATQAAGASAIQLHLPRLVLRSNSIDTLSGTSPLIVTFKDGGAVQTAGTEWKLEVKNWTISPSQGGLVSNKCVLHTGKLDVSFSFFNLRSDFAYLNQPNTNDFKLGTHKITFGQSQAVFGYNPSTGSDKSGHWQLIVYPEDISKPAGMVTGLSPNLSGELQLQTVSLLSNGEDVFTIGPGAAGMMLYQLADFKPLLLSAFTDGFEIIGNTSLKIPRVCSSLGAKLVFGNAGMEVRPVDVSFTGKGNIVFTPNLTQNQGQPLMQKWETRKFTAYGTMAEPGKLAPVQVVLVHQLKSSGPETDIRQTDRIPVQKIWIGSPGTALDTISCSMHADANDWNNFTFEGDLQGFQGMAGKNHMKFTVYGEIKATDQDLKAAGLVENGSSSFSGMQISYENGRMLGTLSIVDAPFGGFKASGSLNILMDGHGWLFYGNATAPNVPLPDPCQANLGLLVGYYTESLPQDVENTVLHYAIRKELPAFVKSDKLLGFFTLAGRDLPLSGLDVSVNVIVASAYVEVPTAGIDGYAYMNAGKGLKVGVGVDGKIQVDFGLNSITCTELYGNAVACIAAEMNNGGLSGCAGMKAKLGIKQEVPLVIGCGGTIIDESITQDASFTFSTPFNMAFKLGGNACPLCK